MSRVRNLLHCFIISFLFIGPAWSADPEEDALYSEASHLIESYNGKHENLTRASDLTAQLLKKNPNSPGGLLNAARLALNEGYINYDNFDNSYVFKAQKLVNQSLKIAPDFADGYILGAYAFIVDKTDKGLRKAKIMAARGEELAPDTPRLDLLYAQIAKKEGNWDEVFRRANLVLSKTEDPTLVDKGIDYLISVYRHRKQYDLAEKAFLSSLELDPESPWTQINFAGFLNGRGRYDDAIEHGEAALKIMDFGMAHHVLGESYYRKASKLQYEEQRYEEAKEFFRLALKHAPDNANAYYGLGVACYYTGHKNKNVAELKEAKIALEQALKLDPNHKQAREQLDNLQKLLDWVKKNVKN